MLTSLFILGFIAVLSGLVAFLGNQLGRFIGKKKMSIFNLRPRYTSMVITIITGAFISLFTIGILTIFSAEARRVVFEMEKLVKERTALLNDLYDLTSKMQNADVIFNVNEPICIGVVEGGLSSPQVKEQVDQLLSRANFIAIDRNNLRSLRYEEKAIAANEKLVGYYPEEYQALLKRLNQESGNWVIMIYSAQNSFFRDKVAVKFNVIPNLLVFKKNVEVTRTTIPARYSRGDIEVALNRLLRVIRSEALKKGVIANPLTGDVGDISIGTLQQTSDKIMSFKGEVAVVVVANSDIYTVGPMNVRFLIKPKR